MKEFNLNLIKYYRKAIIGSAFLFIISISSIIFLNFNFGVDFKGGTVIELTSNDNIQIEEIRACRGNGFDFLSNPSSLLL